MNPAETLDALEADNWAALYRCRHDAKHRKSTLNVLTQLLANPDPAIHHRAMNAVARIRGAFDADNALSDFVPAICNYLTSDDLLTRRIAVGALHCIGNHDVQSTVPALINACDEDALLDAALLALVDVSGTSSDAIRCFHRFAAHSNGKIRRIAIRGLGSTGASDDDSLSLLHIAVSDKNKSVRQMAEKVLAKIAPQP